MPPSREKWHPMLISKLCREQENSSSLRLQLLQEIRQQEPPLPQVLELLVELELLQELE